MIRYTHIDVTGNDWLSNMPYRRPHVIDIPQIYEKKNYDLQLIHCKLKYLLYLICSTKYMLLLKKQCSTLPDDKMQGLLFVEHYYKYLIYINLLHTPNCPKVLAVLFPSYLWENKEVN